MVATQFFLPSLLSFVPVDSLVHLYLRSMFMGSLFLTPTQLPDLLFSLHSTNHISISPVLSTSFHYNGTSERTYCLKAIVATQNWSLEETKLHCPDFWSPYSRARRLIRIATAPVTQNRKIRLRLCKDAETVSGPAKWTARCLGLQVCSAPTLLYRTIHSFLLTFPRSNPMCEIYANHVDGSGAEVSFSD
jgi:hypothetical protein